MFKIVKAGVRSAITQSVEDDLISGIKNGVK